MHLIEQLAHEPAAWYMGITIALLLLSHYGIHRLNRRWPDSSVPLDAPEFTKAMAAGFALLLFTCGGVAAVTWLLGAVF